MIELKMNSVYTIFLFTFLITILVLLIYIIKKWKKAKKPSIWNYQDDVIIEEDKVEQVEKDQPFLKSNSTLYNPFIEMHS